MLTACNTETSILPLVAFEHLSLYIQKHLGQSVEVGGSLWKGRSWQTKAEPGTARYNRAQLDKARYSAEKAHHVPYFLKSRRFEDIKYNTERSIVFQ